ncbi:MAG: hypothetical protein ACREIA_07540 [Opitutaceae bacterium]
MIFAELKPQIEQLPREEMLKAVVYLKHLVRAENDRHRLGRKPTQNRKPLFLTLAPLAPFCGCFSTPDCRRPECEIHQPPAILRFTSVD